MTHCCRTPGSGNSRIPFTPKGSDKENTYRKLELSLYWAIITMTTVGYGDMTPQTTAGRMVEI
jgi:hypothetical protein